VTRLEVDPVRMRANIDADLLAEARQLGYMVSAPEEYLGSASVFVDHALARYEA
jgi:hypothetical protein